LILITVGPASPGTFDSILSLFAAGRWPAFMFVSFGVCMAIVDWLSAVLGTELPVHDVGPLQMALRACVIYLFTLLAIKFGKRRLLGRSSTFDIVIMIIIGSVMSRAINGGSPFWTTLAACVALIALHSVVSWITSRFPLAARAIEGRPRILMADGSMNWREMRRHDVTEQDLHSALREMAHTDQLSPVKAIVLEANGKLSVVMK